jgi:hypothetical protein
MPGLWWQVHHRLMVDLPIKAIRDFPSEIQTLHKKLNGMLPRDVLAVQPGSHPTLTMCKTAMRSLIAMAAAEKEATGLTLRVTSSADSYRPFAVQKSLFKKRYSHEPTPHGSKRWDSDGDGKKERWFLKSDKLAQAAAPGTSNHGLGLACDFVLDGHNKIRDWLIDRAHEFGFSAELQSEPWHWRYIVGDAIPAATLAFEEDDMAFTEDQMRAFAWQYNGRGLDDNDKSVKGNTSALGAFNEILLTVRAIAKKVQLDQAELAAITLAAKKGAQAAIVANTDELVEAIVAALPQENLTKADVEAAIRKVAKEREAVPAPG